MKRTLLPLLMGTIALTSTFSAAARSLTPEEALERVRTDSPMPAKARSASTKLIYTATPANSQEAGAYVFSTGAEGFMVLSADDDAPAVLGYSDYATIDVNDMAPDFRYWLEQYAAQIDAARQKGVRKATSRHTQHAPIEPMVKTHWNQDAPYNDMTPEVNGVHSVTGCVATALAQIMNYHQWPPKGQGSNTYEWTDQNKTLSLDFSTITFDWANMADNYNSQSTEAQKKAVAELMYACGIAVDMQYSPQSSGAQTYILADVMYRYFNYDKSIIVLERDFYDLYEWEDIVYDQLENYGPVQYSGVSSDGGHSFVCDGYSSDGYFHINWGWGGMSDGYFLLTALDPETQGIGGSSSGYNSYQDIVANVGRPKSNTSFTYQMSMQSFSISSSAVMVGNPVRVSGYTYNSGISSLQSGSLGMKAVSENGTVTYISGTSFTNMPIENGYDYWNFSVHSTMAEGTYNIYPVFKVGNGDWQPVQVPISGSRYYIMTISGNVVNFSAPQPVTVSISDVSVESEIYAGVSCHITASMTNEFDYDFYGYIAPVLISGSQVYAQGSSTMVNVPGGAVTDLDYMGSFSTTVNKTAIQTGQYQLAFFDLQTGEAISDPITVTVNEKPSSTTVAVTDLKINEDNVVTDLGNVTFSGNFTVTKGAYGDSFMIFIFPEDGGSSLDYVYSSPIFAAAGQTVPFSFKGALSAVESGKSYLAAAFASSTQISDGTAFRVDLSTGITSVEAVEAAMYPTITDGTSTFSGATPAKMRVFSSSGALVTEVVDSDSVDLSAMPSGIYFIEITQKDTNSKIINRVIRR